MWESRLAHTIVGDAAPHAEVVIRDLAGDRTDYRLDRKVGEVAKGSSGDTSMSAVNMRLMNTASTQSLPDYSAGSMGPVRRLALQGPSRHYRVVSAPRGLYTYAGAAWRQTV